MILPERSAAGLPALTDTSREGSSKEPGFDSPDVVSADYIEEVRAILKQLPTDLPSLESAFRGDTARKNDGVDYYVAHFAIAPIPGCPDPNPFKLISPEELKNIENWLQEKRKRHEYNTRSYRVHSKQDTGFDPAYESSKHENHFIKVISAWNYFHAGFLLILNTPDNNLRVSRLGDLKSLIFDKKPGFTQSIAEISPYDNYEQWLVFNVLNVLISPEERISPVARFRALECLTGYDNNKLADAFFGKDSRSISSVGRTSPDFSYGFEFKKRLMRLPRSFWTEKERGEDIHNRWQENPKILTLFGVEGKPGWDTKYDYATIVNRLVQNYPGEAVHIALLMIAGSDSLQDHSRAGLEALIAFTKVDPISRQKIFGPRATYLQLHKLTLGTRGKIEDALGIEPFIDDRFPDLNGLPYADVVQIAERHARTIQDLEERLAKFALKEGEHFFSTASSSELDEIDPKGYWRILGVHPTANPDDLNDVLQAVYRTLARKYHSDISKHPDDKQMGKINEAYSVLSDEETRREYMKMGKA